MAEIFSVIAKTVLGSSIKKLMDNLKKDNKFKLRITTSEIEHALTSHVKKRYSWSQSLEGINISTSKEVNKSYLPLDYYVTPKQHQYKNSEACENLVDTIFDKTQQHFIILGEAGMGKTSSMKKITLESLTNEKYLPQFSFPVVILCREISFEDTDSNADSPFLSDEKRYKKDGNKYYLTRHLQAEFGILLKYIDESFKNYDVKHTLIRNHIWEFINNLNCLFIVDGFDEIPIWQQQSVYNELLEISNFFSQSKIIVTSRTSNFDYSPSNFHTFEIAPLSENQIEEFSKKWLGDDMGERFFQEIQSSAFHEVAGRPLILSYLINLYEINGKIPDVPKSLYQQIIDILLYKWDRARAVIRDSKYKNFEYDDKFTCLI